MRAPEARAKFLVYFAGSPNFDACCGQKMGATVAPISKKLGANPKRWGPLAPWPPLISIAALMPKLHDRLTKSAHKKLSQIRAWIRWQHWSLARCYEVNSCLTWTQLADRVICRRSFLTKPCVTVNESGKIFAWFFCFTHGVFLNDGAGRGAAEMTLRTSIPDKRNIYKKYLF